MSKLQEISIKPSFGSGSIRPLTVVQASWLGHPHLVSYFHVTHADFVIILWFSAQLGHGNRQEPRELSIPTGWTPCRCSLSVAFQASQDTYSYRALLVSNPPHLSRLFPSPWDSLKKCRDPPSGIYQALLTSASHYLSPHTLPAQKNLLAEIPELPRSLKWGKLKEEGNQCMFQKILLALLLWGVQRKTA